ncbi:MAG: hypothetical protein V4642_07040 [Bacteroidota bacterium]
MKSFLVITAALILLSSCSEESVTPSPDKQPYIYFLTDTFNVQSREQEQYYCRMKEDGSERTRILRFWDGYAYAYFSPDGLKVIVGSQIMNIDGTSRHYFSLGNRVRWSPDSRTLAYTVGYSFADSIFITPVTDEKPQFVAIDKGLADLAWMPDSKKIIYSTRDGLLRMVNSNGSDKKILLKTDSLIIESLTAVGDKIFFYYRKPYYSPGGLGIVKSDGTGLQLIPDFPVFTVNDISPDNKELLLSALEEKFYNLYLFDTETLLKRQITFFENAEQVRAAYSHDGKKIIAGAEFTRFTRLFLMDADGSNVKMLGADTTEPAYSSDKYPGWGLQ